MSKKGQEYVPSGYRAEAFRAQARFSAELARGYQATPEHKEKPLYWINSNGITEDIWNGIIETYVSIYADGQKIQKPEFNDLLPILKPFGGELTFYPTRNLHHPLEVRTKTSGHELFLRFKAYTAGPTMRYDKSEEFQEKVEKYFASKGLELVPHTEIC